MLIQNFVPPANFWPKICWGKLFVVSVGLANVLKTQAFVCDQGGKNCVECPSSNAHQVQAGASLDFACPRGTKGLQLKLENTEGKYIIATEVEAYASWTLQKKWTRNEEKKGDGWSSGIYQFKVLICFCRILSLRSRNSSWGTFWGKASYEKKVSVQIINFGQKFQEASVLALPQREAFDLSFMTWSAFTRTSGRFGSLSRACAVLYMWRTSSFSYKKFQRVKWKRSSNIWSFLLVSSCQ